MSDRRPFTPSPVGGVRVLREEGDNWGLIIEREFRHPPELVWEAITDPAHLREWAPFDADTSLGAVGARVTLTLVNAVDFVSETTVMRAEPPRLLVYRWGEHELRWELEPIDAGTRLTLRTKIDRRYIAMGAAGWHLCFDVLDHLLTGQPVGRIAGAAALEYPGWQQLLKEYSGLFDDSSTGNSSDPQ